MKAILETNTLRVRAVLDMTLVGMINTLIAAR
jgi:hypothetical protein